MDQGDTGKALEEWTEEFEGFAPQIRKGVGPVVIC